MPVRRQVAVSATCLHRWQCDRLQQGGWGKLSSGGERGPAGAVGGQGYAWAEDKEHCEEYGRMLNADPSCVSARAKKRGLPQVPSLHLEPCCSTPCACLPVPVRRVHTCKARSPKRQDVLVSVMIIIRRAQMRRFYYTNRLALYGCAVEVTVPSYHIPTFFNTARFDEVHQSQNFRNPTHHRTESARQRSTVQVEPDAMPSCSFGLQNCRRLSCFVPRRILCGLRSAGKCEWQGCRCTGG